MSQIDSLFIRTTLDSHSVIESLIKCLPETAKQSVNYNLEGNIVTNSLTLWTTRAEEYFDDIATYTQKLGFRPTVIIVASERKTDDGDIHFAEATVKLMTETEWDLAAEIWEHILLKREAGKVKLNKDYVAEGSRPNIVEMLNQANIQYTVETIDDL